MSGIFIDIGPHSDANFHENKYYAMRMAYGFRHNNIQEYQKELFNIFSINNLTENAFFENQNWFAFLYGRCFLNRSVNVFNEEFLARLDSEPLESIFSKISGSYIVFLWNKRNNEFYLVTDLISSIPLYIIKLNNQILVSTEWKTFINYKGFSPELNTESVLNTLLFGRVKLTEDPFCRQCITSLPGTIITISDNHQIKQQAYYKYRNNPLDSSADFNEIVETGTQTIRDLVNDHLNHYDHPALFLSGGIDSRLLAASISTENKSKLTAISFGMKGNDESFIAREVAQSLNLRYFDFELNPMHFIDYAQENINICEGQDLFVQGYLLYICDQLRRGWNIDGVIDGMEIGASLGGDYLKKEFKNIPTQKLPEMIFTQFYIHKDPPNQVFSGDIHSSIDRLINKTIQGMEDINGSFDKFDNIYLENHIREVMRLRHRVIRKSLSDVILASDLRYLDLVTSIPLDLKMDRKYENEILKKLNPNLLNYRYQNTLMPLSLPPELWKKGREIISAQESLAQDVWKKHKINVPNNHYYTNFSEWFRSDSKMKQFLSDYLLSKQCRLTQYFVQEDWLHKIIHEHFQGIQDHRTSISYLMSIELFLQQFHF